jgi:trehalose synthase
MAVPDAIVRQVLEWIGVRLDRPLVTQVARFDPWKDPLGVIAAYRLARAQVPNLQLALVGSMALDDPEGWEVYQQIRAAIRDDPFIHVFTNLTGVGNIEVNAFQRQSEVIVQKSIREGFGLVVSEALWKGTPVVAGRTGGIPLQMGDEAGGILVDGVEACAAAIVALLEDPQRAKHLGERGRERVREHFLILRPVLNLLTLMQELLAGRPGLHIALQPGEPRDPVCGMALYGVPHATETFEGQTLGFCSEVCHRRFLDSPRRYAQVLTGKSVA